MSGVISYPIPAYSNLPINAQYYQPSQFNISAITLGLYTTVTTSVDHNYVVGQLVRLLVPVIYGSYQLNETEGYVLSIPAANQVVVSIDSSQANAFIASPYTATITAITQAAQAVVTANNSFLRGNSVQITGVSGMTQINGLVGIIQVSGATSFTLNINSSAFSAYTSGGVATLFNVPQIYAQILAIGDVNTGTTNSSGRSNNGTYIPGSFIDISPL